MILEGFAGPGGFSEALRMLGVAGGPGIELNADAVATAQTAGHPRIRKDIREVDPADFSAAEGWVSGPPCPTFSASGKRSGIGDYSKVLDGVEYLSDIREPNFRARRRILSEHIYDQVADERTGLVLETLEVALELPNLRWLVAEQVPPVRDIWIEIAAELSSMHRFESVNVVTLAADDLGAATRRTRTFLIAAREHTPDFTGVPIRAWWQAGRFASPVELGQRGGCRFPHTSMAEALHWPPGVVINSRGDRKTPGGNLFSADLPAPSLTGNGARTWYRTDAGYPDGRLTPAQAGLLQGFPADYPWQGSRTSCFQRIADSVSPLMAVAVLGAVLGVPWQEAVWRRIGALYGHGQPGQIDLFSEVAA